MKFKSKKWGTIGVEPITNDFGCRCSTNELSPLHIKILVKHARYKKNFNFYNSEKIYQIINNKIIIKKIIPIVKLRFSLKFSFALF